MLGVDGLGKFVVRKIKTRHVCNATRFLFRSAATKVDAIRPLVVRLGLDGGLGRHADDPTAWMTALVGTGRLMALVVIVCTGIVLGMCETGGRREGCD